MQRWTFPSFRLPTGTNNPHPGITRFHSQSPETSSNQVHLHPSPPAPGLYRPSSKHNRIESTLRSRITKQKAKNDRLRKNIANLEAKSAYLRRLEELEKEVEQLEREGRELARREEEVRRVVEVGELEVEGFVEGERDGEGWGVDVVDHDDGHGGLGDGRGGESEARTRDRDREGSVKREEDSEEKQQERVGRFKRENESGDEEEDGREVKQEAEAQGEVEDPLDKWIEEIELLSGAAAWRWLDSRLAVEI